MNELINNSLTFQIEKKERKKKQDEIAHKKREDANWRSSKIKKTGRKNKIKKIGKKRLSLSSE